MSQTRVGTIVGGSYRLKRILGEGGMGSVYEAEHLRVPRKFAVKILKPEVASNQEMFDRFRREAEIASASGHEHIIEVIDFNVTDDGAPYMILEYLDGETLAQRISRKGRLSVAQTISVIEAVAGALEATHAKGVVHRDLKPQNIFLIKRGKRDDFVKVLDFGISKVLHDGSLATKSGAILGTPNYMAPEQLSGNNADIDRRTDVWALGAIAYECLTATIAFNGPTMPGILYQVCHGQPKPLQSLVPDLPDDLPKVIARALEKNSERRYQTAGAFRDAFLRACGRSVSSHPPPSIETRKGVPEIPIDPRIVFQPEAVAHDASAPTVADPSGRFSQPPQLGTLNTSAREVATQHRRPPWIAIVIGVALVASGGLYWKFSRTGPSSTSTASPSASTSPSPASIPTPSASPTPSTSVAPTSAATITVRLNLDPKDAVVEMDGQPVKAPLHLPRADRSYKLVVKAPGYVTLMREVQADSDKELDLRLDKETKTTSISKPTTAKSTAPPPVTSTTTAPTKPPEPKIEVKGPMEKTL